MTNKDYRDNYVSSKIDTDLAAQIYSLRDQRGLTQIELGDLADMKQPRIAKMEASCEGVSLTTLKRLASAFDVGLSVRFVSFSELAGQSGRENLDRAIPTFPLDRPAIESLRFNHHVSSLQSHRYAIPRRMTPTTRTTKLLIHPKSSEEIRVS